MKQLRLFSVLIVKMWKNGKEDRTELDRTVYICRKVSSRKSWSVLPELVLAWPKIRLRKISAEEIILSNVFQVESRSRHLDGIVII